MGVLFYVMSDLFITSSSTNSINQNDQYLPGLIFIHSMHPACLACFATWLDPKHQEMVMPTRLESILNIS